MKFELDVLHFICGGGIFTTSIGIAYGAGILKQKIMSNKEQSEKNRANIGLLFDDVKSAQHEVIELRPKVDNVAECVKQLREIDISNLTKKVDEILTNGRKK